MQRILKSIHMLQAHKEGLAKDVPIDQVEARIQAKIWTPRYVPYLRSERA